VSFGDLGEVDRIEVLKGPQGTLFGKNTSAGVINILTAGPTDTLEAESTATAGNFGQVGFTGSLSGPLADGLKGRIYGALRKRDGFQDIVVGPGPRTRDDDNDQDFWTLRGQLLWEPTETVSLRVIGDFTKRDESCCVGTQLFVGASPVSRARLIEQVRPGSLDLTSTPFDRRGYANRPTDQRVEDTGLSGELNWELNEAVALTSITAWRNWQAETGQDSDFTAADLVYRPNDGRNGTEFEQFSQEIRFAGAAMDGRLNWLVGGFYAHETLDNRSLLLNGADQYAFYAQRVLGGVPALIGLLPGTVIQLGSGYDDRFHQENDSWALFTNNSYKLTDALELTLGLRYTVDEKSLRSRYSTTGTTCDQAEAALPILVGQLGAATAQRIAGGLCINPLNNDFDELGEFTQSRTEREWSGTAKLAYRFNPTLMTYVSYARGYKAGGFNLDREQRILIGAGGLPNFTADPDTSFRGEFVDSWELGAKATLLGGNLILNGALFHQKYEDFQLNTFEGTAFIVETLPEVISQGVDTDFIWRTPVEGLSVQGGVTYAETEIQPFTAADLVVASRFNALRRLPGARLSFAPLWSASLSGTYEHELSSDLLLRSNVSAKYTSSYNTGSDLHPSKLQDELVLVNGRISLGSPEETWALELWSNNLFDEDYIQVGFNGLYQVDLNDDSISTYDAFLGAPRTWGATLRFRY
ncbi:MAG: TonB-dependent receptor, partial [Phenylobacterium sp.]